MKYAIVVNSWRAGFVWGVREDGNFRYDYAVRPPRPESDRANSPSIIFYDRRGNVVIPGAQSIIKPRRGVFALVVAINNDAIMLSAESCAPDVPELPGGGIEQGETLDEATRREWAEEVGIAFDVRGPFQRFQHVRGFYADDRDEFWIYDQTFRLYHFLGPVKIGQKWRNPEGGMAGWEAIASLPALLINRAHWCAIPTLLSSQAEPTR
ncbi:MAG TPA: NUDIX hydrolase [Steroidobacteraceae bacterium]|jgi:8-oxo-dGTP pyrophosphatase MutT (NUDIX family)|nr:NUDIX hydrolase [Steroidobacteraceae bacterium]